MPELGPIGDVFCIALKVSKEHAGGADALIAKVPFKCRMLRALCGSESVSGSPSALTLMLENGTTDIFSAEADISDPTAPVEATIASGQDALAKDDVLHVDITFTGGTTPKVEGAYCHLWVARE